MEEIISSKLKELGAAQEVMCTVNCLMNRLEESHMQAEQYAFNGINISDKMLTLIHQGLGMMKILNNEVHSVKTTLDLHTGEVEKENIIKGLSNIFQHLLEHVNYSCEYTHDMEQTVLIQCKIAEDLKTNFNEISGQIDQMSACAEMLLTISEDMN